MIRSGPSWPSTANSSSPTSRAVGPPAPCRLTGPSLEPDRGHRRCAVPVGRRPSVLRTRRPTAPRLVRGGLCGPGTGSVGRQLADHRRTGRVRARTWPTASPGGVQQPYSNDLGLVAAAASAMAAGQVTQGRALLAQARARHVREDLLRRRLGGPRHRAPDHRLAVPVSTRPGDVTVPPAGRVGSGRRAGRPAGRAAGRPWRVPRRAAGAYRWRGVAARGWPGAGMTRPPGPDLIEPARSLQ